MNQLAVRLFLGGAVILLGGCSDDDGSDVVPKDPSAQAGSGGGGGSGGSGGAAGAAGGGAAGAAGNGGGGGGGAPPDAGPGDVCTPVFPDAGALDAGSGDAGDAAGPFGAVGFAADIHPILAMRCGPCHVTDFSGGHNVASADLMEAYGFASQLKGIILERVNGGGMPPSETGCNGPLGSPSCVTLAEFELMERWAAQCFPP